MCFSFYPTVKSQVQSREQHDAFHSQLEKSDDGFAVVADYFGRGMFRGQTFLESTVASTINPIQVDRHGQTASSAGGQKSSGYLQAPVAPTRKSPIPVVEEKPIAVTTRYFLKSLF